MQSTIKSIFSYCAIIVLCVIFPANVNAQEENQEPETLINSPLLGSKYSELKQPLIPLNGAPEAQNFGKCMRLGVLSMRPQFQCEYKAGDGINYYIDRNGIIYKIRMMADAKGKFPKPLPFGINPTDSPYKIETKLKKLGLNYKDDNVGITATYEDHMPCYEQNNSFKKMACFFYNEDRKISYFQISSWEFETFKSKQDNSIANSNKN